MHQIKPSAKTEDEDDKEFAILAAESLTKTPIEPKSIVAAAPGEPQEENWAAFVSETTETQAVDPFDTSFAENIYPGKAELKLIENEILTQENNINFDSNVENKLAQIINKVSINVTDPAGQRESITSLDRVSGDFLKEYTVAKFVIVLFQKQS